MLLFMQEEGPPEIKLPTFLEFLGWLKGGYGIIAAILLVVGGLLAVNLILYIETTREITLKGLGIRLLATSLTIGFGLHFALTSWGSFII
jgi:hypothetical protein